MSQRIKGIIFSHDNPAQLSLLLESIRKNAKDVFALSILISHSSEEFLKGYEKILAPYSATETILYNPIYLSPESDLKELVLGLLKTDFQYSCFFLDDDIIYNNVELEDITNQIEADEDVVCFSLRLGENTTKCYTLGAENVLHDIKYNGKFMKWDWSLHYLDFGYPFAMDGHVFRTKDIYKLVRKCKFNTVEELEMGMFDFTETFPRNMMTSYKTSALVGVPIGRVQLSLDNEMEASLQEIKARAMRKSMNDALLNNAFINLESIDFSNIAGCHQELDIGVTWEENIKIKTK